MIDTNQFENCIFLQVPDTIGNNQVHALWRAEYGKKDDQGAYVATTWKEVGEGKGAKRMPWARNGANTIVMVTSWTKPRIEAVHALIPTTTGLDLLDYATARQTIRAYES